MKLADTADCLEAWMSTQARAGRIGVRMAAVAGIAALATGCASLSVPGSGEQRVPRGVTPVPTLEQAGATAPEAFRDAPPAPAGDSARWWALFADPVLDGLVRAALDEAISVQIAEARLVEARSQGRSVISGFAPRLVASAGSDTTNVLSGPDLIDSNGNPVSSQTTGSAAVRASWEVPLFGRFGAALAGSRASTEAAELGIESARIAVVADLAAAYVDLRTAQLRVSYLEDDLARAERLVRISEDRARVGLISQAEAGQARGQAANVRAQLPDARLAVRAGLDRIALLRGVMPGSLDTLLANPEPREAQVFKTEAPDVSSIPADLLRRRPDVRAAEQQALVQAAAVGVARADLYPSVSIQGAISLLGAISGNPLAESIGRGTLSPTISLPLFDLGQRRAGVETANARLTQALLSYRSTTLVAVQEGQQALAAYAQGRERVRAAQASERAAQERFRATDSGFRAGILSLKELLEAEDFLSNARLNRLTAQARVSDAAVGLYRAFAGAPGI
jgi:NodT family efflux transporter outer membrane factor (OMF) lipoprotein